MPGDADVIDLRLGRVPPPQPVVLEGAGRPRPGPASPPSGTQAPPATPGGSAAPGPAGGTGAADAFYVVQPGDTLSSIAHQHLGSAALADELVRLNRLDDADGIIAGQVLRLR